MYEKVIFYLQQCWSMQRSFLLWLIKPNCRIKKMYVSFILHGFMTYSLTLFDPWQSEANKMLYLLPSVNRGQFAFVWFCAISETSPVLWSVEANQILNLLPSMIKLQSTIVCEFSVCRDKMCYNTECLFIPGLLTMEWITFWLHSNRWCCPLCSA